MTFVNVQKKRSVLYFSQSHLSDKMYFERKQENRWISHLISSFILFSVIAALGFKSKLNLKTVTHYYASLSMLLTLILLHNSFIYKETNFTSTHSAMVLHAPFSGFGLVMSHESY